MKRPPSRSLALFSSLHLLLITPLLFSSAQVSAASLTAARDADPTPILALYQTVDNNTEPACGLELPTAGSGATVRLFPKTTCPPVKDEDEKDKPIKPHAIRIRNMPIKSTFLLTDNDRCEKANSAWVELDTSRANASLEKMGIDKLWTYAGSAEAPGYLTNSGLDSNVPSRGFRIIGKGDAIRQGELTCIVVTTASRSN